MSTQPGNTPVQQQAAPARMSIIPDPGLDELLSQHDAAKAALAETAAREKDLRIQVESRVINAHPGVPAFEIAGNAYRPPVRLTWVDTVRLDTKAMKEQEPETYVRFAVFGGKWVLGRVQGGGR